MRRKREKTESKHLFSLLQPSRQWHVQSKQ